MTKARRPACETKAFHETISVPARPQKRSVLVARCYLCTNLSCFGSPMDGVGYLLDQVVSRAESRAPHRRRKSLHVFGVYLAMQIFLLGLVYVEKYSCQ